MDKSTDATTKTSASATNNASDAATNMASNDAISTNALKSPTMHENNSKNNNKTNNLGCGSSASAETAATPIHHSNYNNNMKNNHIKETSPNNSGNTSSTGASSSSILTTAMAAANGLPLQRSQQQPHINLQINTTTGGNFGVTVDAQITVETLKKLISKKLKVAKDRICLLHREKELHDGTLNENNLMDGSKIILIPNVETGLLAQRPENTVMQALESLNDSQVNDFLSGKTPLNLSMRLGDHMMLIQLQLSTVNPIAQGLPAGLGATASSHHHHHHHGCSVGRRSSLRATTQRLLTNNVGSNNQEQQKLAQQQQQQPTQIQFQQSNQLKTQHHQQQQHPIKLIGQASGPVRKSDFSEVVANKTAYPKSQASPVSIASITGVIETDNNTGTNNGGTEVKITTKTATKRAGSPIEGPFKKSDLSAFFSKQNVQSLQSIVKSFNTRAKETTTTIAAAASTATTGAAATTLNNVGELEQSPIKSLSNLVSSPIKTMPIKHIPQISSSAVGAVSTTKHPLQHPQSTYGGHSKGQLTTCQDPIAAQLTSCLCTRLNVARNIINNTINNKIINADVNKQNSNNNPNTNIHKLTSTTIIPNNNTSVSSSNNNNSCLKQCLESNTCRLRHSSSTGLLMLASSTPKLVITPSTNGSGSGSEQGSDCLHKTANNSIVRNKHHRHHHHHHHHHHHNIPPLSSSAAMALGVARPKQIMRTGAAVAATTSSSSTSANNSANDSGFILDSSTSSTASPASSIAAPAAAATVSNTSTAQTNIEDTSQTAITDTRTLAEASRNLTQTLRKLSKEVFTNKIDLSAVSSDEIAPRKTGSGAVIESMKNHGKGIYSGTFSGTLNPALQDRYGRPKRDISTVIHILNDLLSATPQYSRGARISVESPSTSAAAVLNDAANGSHQNSKSKQITIKPYHPCLKCIRSVHHSHHYPNGVCNSGECNKNKTLSCCIDTTCSQMNSGIDGVAYRDRHVCTCSYRIIGETGERELEEMCQKCLVDMENSKTKTKLDQLRLVMQQRKEKREARKQKGAPYTSRPFSPTTAAISTPSLSTNELAKALITPTASSVTSMCAESVSLTPTKATLAASTPTTTTSATAAAAPATATTNSSANTSEVPPNHIVEEVDTAA